MLNLLAGSNACPPSISLHGCASYTTAQSLPWCLLCVSVCVCLAGRRNVSLLVHKSRLTTHHVTLQKNRIGNVPAIGVLTKKTKKKQSKIPSQTNKQACQCQGGSPTRTLIRLSQAQGAMALNSPTKYHPSDAAPPWAVWMSAQERPGFVGRRPTEGCENTVLNLTGAKSTPGDRERRGQRGAYVRIP